MGEAIVKTTYSVGAEANTVKSARADKSDRPVITPPLKGHIFIVHNISVKPTLKFSRYKLT